MRPLKPKLIFKIILTMIITLILALFLGEYVLRNFTSYQLNYCIDLGVAKKEIKKLDQQLLYKRRAEDIEINRVLEEKNLVDYKIMLLGDSIAAGGELEDVNNRFADLLQDKFEEVFGEEAVSLLVLADGGYSTLTEVALYEKYRRRYKPDLIIIAYCNNDVDVYPKMVKKDGRYVLLFYNTTIKYLKGIPFNRQLTKKFLIARLINAKLIKGLLWTGVPIKVQITNLEKGRINNALQKLQVLSNNDDTDVLVVFFPYLQDISEWDKERRFAESIKQRCRKYGFDVLDLLPIYKKSARKEDVYDYEKLKVRQSDICHPNALGHEVAAEAIFEKIYPLIKEGLKSK